MRFFVIRCKPYGEPPAQGQEVYIFEGGTEIGVTQTAQGKTTDVDAIAMAREWLEISDIPADQISIQVAEPLT